MWFIVKLKKPGLYDVCRSLCVCASCMCGVVSDLKPGQELSKFCRVFDVISQILNSCDKNGLLLHICAASVIFSARLSTVFFPQKRFAAIIGLKILSLSYFVTLSLLLL